MENFEAVVSNVIFRNEKNYYSIILGMVNGNSEILIGYFPIINKGLKIFCYGKKEKGRNKKDQYKVESYSIKLPDNDYHLFQFLINDFVNMELSAASFVADVIGVEYLEKHADFKYLENKIDDKKMFNKILGELKGASFQLSEIKRKLDLMETMIQMGFPNDISAKVSFSDIKLTSNSIKNNPYQLIFPFDLDWKQIDNIGLKNGIEKESDIRIQEAIGYLLDNAVKKLAHIYLHREEVYRQLKNLLNLNLGIEKYNSNEEQLIKNKNIYCDVDDHIYGYRYFVAEKQLANDLYRISEQEKEDNNIINEMMLSLDDDEEFTYSPEQKKAIKTTLREPLSIIVGYPGSGKTTTIRKIIMSLMDIKKKQKKEKYKILLSAPTGRAAERMKEVTGLDAKTLHSILNHHPLFKTPMFDEHQPIDADCLIIDEASMIDTILFSEIINAIKKGTKVIIVGDPDQLPSIGAGNVLHELINNSDFPTVKLETIFRQGKESSILDLSTKIRKGDASVDELLMKKNDEFTFVSENNAKKIADVIVNTAKLLLEKPNFDFYNEFQIITPIHKSDIGTVRLNQRIQDLLNQKGKRLKVTFADKDFYVGDKVIHTVNNNSKKVFNGEIGRVKQLIKKKLVVEFPNNKIIEYEGDELFELELAFATSVHKMQGSEASLIIFPMHSIFKNMLQRKLLYTGVTRAKNKLMLLGQAEIIKRAIDIDTALERNCNLQQRLREAHFENI